MEYSAKGCVRFNQFEYAVEKYENANGRWKAHWWETVVTIYNKSKEWAKKYVLDFTAKTVINISIAVRTHVLNDNPIIWNCEKIDYPNGSQLVYLIRLLNDKHELIYSKVGTTTRTVEQRMKEHLRSYFKENIKYIEIDRVYDCGEYEAEGLESEFRSKYIRKFKNAFKKNDRFRGVEFDLENADTIFENFMKE